MAKRARVGERTMIIVIASFFPPVVVAKVGGGERECEVGASQEKKEARRRGRKGGSDRGAIIPSPRSLLLLLFLSLSFLHYFFSPPSFPPPQTGGKRKGGLRLLFPLPFLICLSPFLLEPFFPTIMITEPTFLPLLSAALRPFVEGRGGKKREKRSVENGIACSKGIKRGQEEGGRGKKGKREREWAVATNRCSLRLRPTSHFFSGMKNDLTCDWCSACLLACTVVWIRLQRGVLKCSLLRNFQTE